MQSSTVIGLAILGVAVTGGAVAVVYVLKNKSAEQQATGQNKPAVQDYTTKPLVTVSQENASKPPTVSTKEPSTWEILNGACKAGVDPASQPWCGVVTGLGQKWLS